MKHVQMIVSNPVRNAPLVYWIVDENNEQYTTAHTEHAAQKLCDRLNKNVGYEKYSVLGFGTADNPASGKTFKYKKWQCVWNKSTSEYDLYTPDEMEQPRGFRYSEMSASTVQQCKDFIDDY